jgi:uncharacterized damage-inducible protein DinB
MTLEDVRLLYEYNGWANNRVLDACARLSQDEFTRDLGSSFSSVRDTLVHIWESNGCGWSGGTAAPQSFWLAGSFRI